MSEEAIIASIKEDVEELEKLLSVATRPKVKDVLTVEIRKLQTQIVNCTKKVEKEESKTENEKKDKAPVTKPVSTYTKKITAYGWDQSEKFLKIYLTSLDGVHNLPKENITSEYGQKSVKITITGLDNKNHELHIGNLFSKIIPGDSYFKVKTDMVLVMLKKAETTTWAYVTEQEKKKKEKKLPKPDETKEPGAGIMDMMKQMYDDGDDEMKRTIAKAWHDSQEKKASGDIL